jgi:His-Xaa-Ser system protein HxsD
MSKDQEKNKEIMLEVDSRVYSKRTVMEAAAKFMDKYHIRIEEQSSQAWHLVFTSKEPGDGSLESPADAFQNDLLDRQLRLELEESFKEIREMIVRQAFWPFEPDKKN